MKILLHMIACALLLSSTTAIAEEPAKDQKDQMTLTTNAYLDKLAIPTLYTCDGKNVSPQLTWTNVPAKAASLAVVMTDVDAPKAPFYHWVLFNIPKSVTELAEGAPTPAGASTGKNNFDKPGYGGPCPPKGTAHTYIITLYALDQKLSLPKDADAASVVSAMKNHIIGQVELSGVYSRWIQ